MATTGESINTWMLNFRGEEGKHPNQPVLESIGYAADYFPQELGHTGTLPNPGTLIPIVLKIKATRRVQKCLDSKGNKKFTFEPPFVKLDFTGFEASETLTINEKAFSPRATVNNSSQVFLSKPPLGSTENLLIKATLKTRTNIPESTKAPRVESSDERAAERITLNNMHLSAEDSAEQPDVMILIRDFKYVQPILYLEQPNDSFVLLAEVSCREDPADERAKNERRILFAIQNSISTDEGENPTASISKKQLVLISPPYEVADGLEYTIRVQQDGDLLFGHDHQSYLEFWVESIPVGIYKLESNAFPFKVNVDTRICIGYWPRAEMGKKIGHDWEDLFFQGDLGEIIVDPHGLCPCAG